MLPDHNNNTMVCYLHIQTLWFPLHYNQSKNNIHSRIFTLDGNLKFSSIEALLKPKIQWLEHGVFQHPMIQWLKQSLKSRHFKNISLLQQSLQACHFNTQYYRLICPHTKKLYIKTDYRWSNNHRCHSENKKKNKIKIKNKRRKEKPMFYRLPEPHTHTDFSPKTIFFPTQQKKILQKNK